jgi:CDGSH-type Zn-finger protein
MTTRITVINNGSLRVEGDDFEIVDQEGRVFGLGGRSRVTLCRCGQSDTKPFCDSTHRRCGFESVLIARDLPPPVPKPAP